MRKFGLTTFLVFMLTLLFSSQAVLGDWDPGDGHKMHFPQLPDEDGWNVNATAPLILADDWRCSQDGYVKDIHFWGSWRDFDGDMLGDVGTIIGFQLSIHDDIPADPCDGILYSRPGPTLWEFFAEEFFPNPIDPPAMEGWMDPNTGEVIYNDHGDYWQYNIDLRTLMPEGEMFWQEKDRIYWLNISAILQDPVNTQWGWKSTEDHWMDDAVWAEWGDLTWEDIFEPEPPEPPDTFWIALGPGGGFLDGGGSGYNGGEWYYYEDTGWWNQWYYDGIFDPNRDKIVHIEFVAGPAGPGPSQLVVALNWSTPEWPDPCQPPIPPLDPTEEDQYIRREVLLSTPDPQGDYKLDYIIRDYNPVWVSIDVNGVNFVITDGTIEHTCVQSLDLAFVITGDNLDFGDAPDLPPPGTIYPTLLANNGARHIIGGPWMGPADDAPDWEPDGQPNNLGLDDDMDGNDDEDGLTLPTLTAGQSVNFNLQVNNAPAAGAAVQIFIDYNIDGDWIDAGELAYSGLLPNGINAITFPVPAAAVPGMTFARGRISTAGTGNPFGQAPDGEVEDTEVLIEEPELDFGDAPDLPPPGTIYPTLLANNGARHIIGGPWMGDITDSPDAEPDGQPNNLGLDDDMDGNDDEDGLTLPTLTAGQSVNFNLQVNNAPAAGAAVQIFIDYNIDGDWIDAGELAYSGLLPNGINAITFPVPTAAVPGMTFARGRISTAGTGNPFGQAPDGEVEDTEVLIEEAELDFGDAPPPYPTLLANNGARHIITAGPWLGPADDAPDPEPDGQPVPPAATGDDLDADGDDEDGVTIPVLTQGVTALIAVVVDGGGGVVQIWIDFNGDGDWDDPGELIGNWSLPDGPYNLPVTPPIGSVVGQTFARCRINSQMTVGPTGLADDGEVEDHEVYIEENPKYKRLKWSQPPIEWDPMTETPIYCGWDELSMYPHEDFFWKMAADDYRCIGNMPVTSVHFWGSHQNWDGPEPPDLMGFDSPIIQWHIGFWSNLPAGFVTPWSSPEFLLHEVFVDPSRVDWEWVGMDQHPDPMYPFMDSCFQYYVQLDPVEYFWQGDYLDGTIDDVFWVSIMAIYPDIVPIDYPWGWKTRPWSWMDDAITVKLSEPPMPGMPIFPWDVTPIENALVCTTGEPQVKWEQWPDLDFTGLDVDATMDMGPGTPQILADDFQCIQTGPITDIHIWGSWLWDEMPQGDPSNVVFTLSLHEDIPAGLMAPWSMPGDVLWTQQFDPGMFDVTLYASGLTEGWYNPCEGWYEPVADSMCWQYDFYIDPADAFIQRGTLGEPNVYWLDVQAWTMGDPIARFGWKTSLDHWNDDGAWAIGVEPYFGPWEELRYPDMHPYQGDSIDLAFKITGPEPESYDLAFELDTDPNYVKWEQHYTGIRNWPLYHDEPSWAEDPDGPGGADPNVMRLVADDWQCQRRTPVTAIGWWGSYIGYTYEACAGCITPPQQPDYFQLRIWTDVPAGVDLPISHPNDIIWAYDAYEFDEVLVGYDKHPLGVSKEPVFRYSVRLPEDEWFEQREVNDIYWLSVVAVYVDPLPGTYPWGWTNHQHVFMDDAVAGTLSGNNGPIWLWEELYSEQAGESVDMSFILFTDPDECVSCPDYDSNNIVDLKDLKVFVDNWLWSGSPGGYNNADLNCNGVVDLKDFAILANLWLTSCP